jgi:hypothetical protein
MLSLSAMPFRSKKIPPLRGLGSRPELPDRDHCKTLRSNVQKGSLLTHRNEGLGIKKVGLLV